MKFLFKLVFIKADNKATYSVNVEEPLGLAANSAVIRDRSALGVESPLFTFVPEISLKSQKVCNHFEELKFNFLLGFNNSNY